MVTARKQRTGLGHKQNYKYASIKEKNEVKRTRRAIARRKAGKKPLVEALKMSEEGVRGDSLFLSNGMKKSW